MYYDITKECVLTDKEAQSRGLPVEDAEILHHLGFYALTIAKPNYDPATEGIEPDGPPAPDPENPLAFVQHMRVFRLLDRAKARMVDAATAKRWEYETGGVTLPDGQHILTGKDDQARVASALTGLGIMPDMQSVDFKAPSGWATITAEELTGIGQIITAHVQGCFSRERALHELIDACTSMDDLNAIKLDEGWPGRTPDTPPDDALPDAPTPDSEHAA